MAGYISGTISNAYATGAVTAASGSYYAGGLVGFQDGGTISEAYATGALSGGGSDVGGLVGESYGTIDDAYATGAVAAATIWVGSWGGQLRHDQQRLCHRRGQRRQRLGCRGAGRIPVFRHDQQRLCHRRGQRQRQLVGGLVGGSGSTISNAYWDTATSGQSSSGGGTAQTTATFQADSLSTLGFDSPVWDRDVAHPYLKSFFPNGAQAISGTAYKDAGANAAASNASGAVTVGLDSGGAFAGQATTGANGYYYIALPAGRSRTATYARFRADECLDRRGEGRDTGGLNPRRRRYHPERCRSLWQFPVRGDERHHIVGR